MLRIVAPLLRAAPRLQQARQMSGGHTPAHWKSLRQICEESKSHMNHMPVPAGSWQESYKAKSGKQNITLAVSIASAVTTFWLLWSNGYIYFHSAPKMSK